MKRLFQGGFEAIVADGCRFGYDGGECACERASMRFGAFDLKSEGECHASIGTIAMVMSIVVVRLAGGAKAGGRKTALCFQAPTVSF